MQDLDHKIEDYIRFVAKTDKEDKIEFGKIIDIRPSQCTVVLLRDPREIVALKNKGFFPNELVQTVNKMTISEKQVMGKLKVLYFSEFIKRFYDFKAAEFKRQEIEAESAYLLR